MILFLWSLHLQWTVFPFDSLNMILFEICPLISVDNLLTCTGLTFFFLKITVGKWLEFIGITFEFDLFFPVFDFSWMVIHSVFLHIVFIFSYSPFCVFASLTPRFSQWSVILYQLPSQIDFSNFSLLLTSLTQRAKYLLAIQWFSDLGSD